MLASGRNHGYRYVAKKEQAHDYYEINDEEARIVRMIFDWVDQDVVTFAISLIDNLSHHILWITSHSSTLKCL